MSYDELISSESIKNNRFSPGIVTDEEKIARVIFSPNHCDIGGNILPAAFDHVLSSGGMSVLRFKYNFEDSLKITVESLQKEGINNYVGFISASVHDIRTITYDIYRVFYILDTATKNKIGHADIFSIRPHEKISLPPKALKRYIRFQIAKVFNKLQEV